MVKNLNLKQQTFCEWKCLQILQSSVCIIFAHREKCKILVVCVSVIKPVYTKCVVTVHYIYTLRKSQKIGHLCNCYQAKMSYESLCHPFSKPGLNKNVWKNMEFKTSLLQVE